jgi:predicted aminopeptidase
VAVYEAGTVPATTRERKTAAFGQMRDEYELLRTEWGGAGNYDRFMGGDLNNASLAAVTSYQRWVPALRSRIDRLGLEAFFEAVEALANLDSAQRTATLESWNAAR